MDARRPTRARPSSSASEPIVQPPVTRGRSPARKSPSRKSPVRKSPARKSPARKSPARRSPARKSPARTKSPITAQKESSAAAANRRKKPTATVPPTAPAVKEPIQTSPVKEARKNEKKSPIQLTTLARTPISISPVKRDLKESSSIQSVTSSTYSTSTRTSVRTRVTRDAVDIGHNTSSDRSGGDLEVSKLTALASFIRRSVSKNPTPSVRTSRSVSHSVYEDDDKYSKTEYSDNEEDIVYESVPKDSLKNSFVKNKLARQNEVPREFGGAYGAALFLLLIPLVVLYLLYSCNTAVCRFKCVNVLNTTVDKVMSLFDRYVTGAFVSFMVLIHLLSSFPFGRVVILPADRGNVQYYFNGILTTLVTIIGLGAGRYYGCPIGVFIWNNYFKLLVISILGALGTALCCYVRARKAPANALNPYAKSGNFLVDYFLGREITPKWFGVIDIKLACYRASIIATFIISLLLIVRNVKLPVLPSGEDVAPLNYQDAAKYIWENVKFDNAALFSASLLATYSLDLILNEHHLASSFDLQQEGVGALLLVRYAATPFLLSVIPRYILLNRSIAIPAWAYAVIATVFFAGLFIKRASSCIKYQYRINPQQTNLLLLDTVPTFQGRRLLLDKWWGTLRQPNYTGDILSLLAYVSPIAFKFSWPPVLCILLIVLFLIHRAVRVNARNFRRYDSAWSRYCSRVRYLLVPKVF